MARSFGRKFSGAIRGSCRDNGVGDSLPPSLRVPAGLGLALVCPSVPMPGWIGTAFISIRRRVYRRRPKVDLRQSALNQSAHAKARSREEQFGRGRVTPLRHFVDAMEPTPRARSRRLVDSIRTGTDQRADLSSIWSFSKPARAVGWELSASPRWIRIAASAFAPCSSFSAAT